VLGDFYSCWANLFSCRAQLFMLEVAEGFRRNFCWKKIVEISILKGL
jgi:hypothetical protein